MDILVGSPQRRAYALDNLFDQAVGLLGVPVIRPTLDTIRSKLNTLATIRGNGG